MIMMMIKGQWRRKLSKRWAANNSTTITTTETTETTTTQLPAVTTITDGSNPAPLRQSNNYNNHDSSNTSELISSVLASKLRNNDCTMSLLEEWYKTKNNIGTTFTLVRTH